MSARSKREQLQDENTELASKLAAAEDSLSHALDVIEEQKEEISELLKKIHQLEDTIKALRGDWVMINGDQPPLDEQAEWADEALGSDL
jgi:predicted  nucleic acid-binding Zn-ribbon protein